MSPWVPWLYQYGVGGALVAATLAVLKRQGRLRPATLERRAAVIAVAGLVSFAVAHAIWIALVVAS